MTDLVNRPDLVPVSDDRPVTTAVVAVDGRLDDSDMRGVAALKEVDQTDDGFLSFLGWERSVDVWDASWPTETKRAVIEAAPIVHRHKGTVYAVKTALSALGVDAIVSEWWQTAPRGTPYTFSIKAYARARLYDGPLLDTRLIKVVYDSVMSAKPESRAFDLIVGANLPTKAGVGPVLIGKLTLGRAMRPLARNRLGAALGLAPALVGKVRVALALVPALPAS